MMRRVLLSSLGVVACLTVASAAAAQLQPPPPMQPMQPMQPQPQPGLAPPPPMQGNGPGYQQPNNDQLQQQETKRKLDEAESSDSKRNFELIWADAHVGGTYIDMAQFSSEDLAIRKASAGGAAFSLGAGVRLVIFYAGLRARYNVLSLFNLWQFNGEAGIKIPIGALDIMAGAHGGYSFVGGLSDANNALSRSAPASNDDVAIRGFNLGADVAVDYYLTPLFSVGVGVLGDFLFLTRSELKLPSNTTPEQRTAAQTDPLYQKDGSAAGLQLAGLLRLGVHFGL